MENNIKKFDLEDRLVAFACMVLEVCDMLPGTRAGNNLEHQLSKSGTAPGLMYGEAQAAESGTDFLHKMKMALKELRETRINLRIIKDKPLIKHTKVDNAFEEVDQLIRIFVKSIDTARSKSILKR
ncbi:four helix bundle protein [Niastella populi]|uniref:Four helix bundle protein n=1 Tax=Niastella populi TaxID=550983 RepID=A0A1V9FR52_9BACT|nr:four helix bundle protein [Niastella populi]OQP60767.1 four helix bundle protein [Niastella populi]